MFSSLRRKATATKQEQGDTACRAADETVHFMAGVEGALGGLRREMINDPFVVGAIAMHAAIMLKVTTNGQSGSLTVESAMTEAVERSLSGTGLARHDVVNALLRFKNNPEYAKGAQAVRLILGARFERKDLQFDPLIIEARASIKAMPPAFRAEFGESEPEQVAHELTHKLIIRPLQVRYRAPSGAPDAA